MDWPFHKLHIEDRRRGIVNSHRPPEPIAEATGTVAGWSTATGVGIGFYPAYAHGISTAASTFKAAAAQTGACAGVASCASSFEGLTFDPNLVADLAVYLDPRDLSAGAISSWIDRANAYEFTGSATADTSINGIASVTSNGTTDILTSTANIAELSGISAITIISIHVDAYDPAFAWPVVYGSGVTAGEFILSTSSPNVITTYAVGNVGATQCYIGETQTNPHIITRQIDFTLGSKECGLFRRDGTAVTSTAFLEVNNSGTFANKALSLLAAPGPVGPWAGHMGPICVFARALTTTEMQYVERGFGEIWGITVA